MEILCCASWLLWPLIAMSLMAPKGQPVVGLVAGLVLGPIGVLLALVSGDKSRRPCPTCGEDVKKVATKCPHCSEPLEPVPFEVDVGSLLVLGLGGVVVLLFVAMCWSGLPESESDVVVFETVQDDGTVERREESR